MHQQRKTDPVEQTMLMILSSVSIVLRNSVHLVTLVRLNCIFQHPARAIELSTFHKCSELEVQLYDKRHQNRVN
jgi:hypothetical protein